jgi:3D (Asp-Asp-Asp) domain-containing protein
MRRIHATRRMTLSDHWELGLFITMLIVGCLVITAVMSRGSAGGVPELSAWNAAARVGSQAASPLVSEISKPNADAMNKNQPQSAERAAVSGAAAASKARAAAQSATPDVKVVGGKEYRYVKTLKLRVTAYAPDARCCYPYDGTTTASGLSVKTNGGKLVAADTSVIPMYAYVTVPGYAGSAAVPVLDKGGAIKGNRLDVMMPTFEQAKAWGSRMLEVKVYQPVN